jgi:hypothetical protein
MLKSSDMKKNKTTIKQVLPISTTSMNPFALMCLSGVFLFVGVILISLAFKVISITSKVNAPREIILLSGLIFFLGGLATFLQSIKSKTQNIKRNKLKRKHPNSPWKWDYNWNTKGINNRNQHSILSHFIGFSITSCFLGLTYWIGFIDKAKFKLPFYGMCLFMLFILMWFYTMISKRIRYGKPYLSFYNFPYKLSENMKIRFSNLPNKNIVNGVTISIRFYEEIFIKDANNRSRVSLDEKYIDFKELPKESISISRDIEVDFDLPNKDHFNTHLSSVPARFWEVQIECDIKGLDYREYFLLPIYS